MPLIAATLDERYGMIAVLLLQLFAAGYAAVRINQSVVLRHGWWDARHNIAVSVSYWLKSVWIVLGLLCWMQAPYICDYPRLKFWMAALAAAFIFGTGDYGLKGIVKRL